MWSLVPSASMTMSCHRYLCMPPVNIPSGITNTNEEMFLATPAVQQPSTQPDDESDVVSASIAPTDYDSTVHTDNTSAMSRFDSELSSTRLNDTESVAPSENLGSNQTDRASTFTVLQRGSPSHDQNDLDDEDNLIIGQSVEEVLTQLESRESILDIPSTVPGASTGRNEHPNDTAGSELRSEHSIGSSGLNGVSEATLRFLGRKKVKNTEKNNRNAMNRFTVFVLS